MAHVALLTRLSSASFPSPKAVAELNAKVEERIKKECPGGRWIANYAGLGPYDDLDIFEAPGNAAATKVALIVRSFGHAHTDTWVATPWERFAEMAGSLKSSVHGSSSASVSSPPRGSRRRDSRRVAQATRENPARAEV